MNIENANRFEMGLLEYKRLLNQGKTNSLNKDCKTGMVKNILAIADSMPIYGYENVIGYYYKNFLYLLAKDHVVDRDEFNVVHKNLLNTLIELTVARNAKIKEEVDNIGDLVSILENSNNELSINDLVILLQEYEYSLTLSRVLIDKSQSECYNYTDLMVRLINRCIRIIHDGLDTLLICKTDESSVAIERSFTQKKFLEALSILDTMHKMDVLPILSAKINRYFKSLCATYLNVFGEEFKPEDSLIHLKYEQDMECYQHCLSVNKFDTYIKEYPEGIFIVEAECEDAQAEKLFDVSNWCDCYKDSKIDVYLEEYPTGIFVTTAQKLIAECN